MADTEPDPNNKTVQYQGKSQSEPPAKKPKADPRLASLRKRGLISDKQSDKLSMKRGQADGDLPKMGAN